METKNDSFFGLPFEVRSQTYSKIPNFPFGALQLMRRVSKKTLTDYCQLFETTYAKTNKIVYDFIDQRLSKIEKPYQYDPLTYKILHPSWSQGNKILCKEWVQQNPAFQKFVYDIYKYYQPDSFTRSPIKELFRACVIHSDIKDDTLQCASFNNLGNTITIEIKSDEIKALSSSATKEMLEPFEAQVKEALGLKDVQNFLEGFEKFIKIGLLGSGQQWCKCLGMEELPYIQLFSDPLFQIHYLNEQISFNDLCEAINRRGAGSMLAWEIESYNFDLRKHSMKLSCYKKYDMEHRSLLEWLKKNPKPLGCYYKENELELLNDDRFMQLIDYGYATLEECVQHGQRLIPGWQVLFKSSVNFPVEVDKKNLNFLGFFCKGLDQNTQKVLKGEAILALYNYLELRQKEETNSVIPNFLKFDNSYKDKINSALTLIFVLFEIKGKHLSEKDIKVLSRNMGQDNEDRLTKIVREKVLLPLNLLSLEALNDEEMLRWKSEYVCK